MYQLSILLGTLVCLSQTQYLAAGLKGLPPGPGGAHHSSSSATHKDKIGDFTLVGFAKDSSVVLSNNVIYEPSHKSGEKAVKDWQLGDTIRVLQGEKDDKFILVNLRTGQTIKAKITDLS